jgi:hypothetical protein
VWTASAEALRERLGLRAAQEVAAEPVGELVEQPHDRLDVEHGDRVARRPPLAGGRFDYSLFAFNADYVCATWIGADQPAGLGLSKPRCISGGPTASSSSTGRVAVQVGSPERCGSRRRGSRSCRHRRTRVPGITLSVASASGDARNHDVP